MGCWNSTNGQETGEHSNVIVADLIESQRAAAKGSRRGSKLEIESASLVLV